MDGVPISGTFLLDLPRKLDDTQHLDVMYFPVLFPTGKFGKLHPRDMKLSYSEYIRSRQGFTFSKRCPVSIVLTVAERNVRALGMRIQYVEKYLSVRTLLNKVDASDEGQSLHNASVCGGTMQYDT